MGLQQTKADWNRLGANDPLWAVLATPEHRHGQWDREAFLATGRREIDAVLEHATGLGLTPPRERALDFGCGAGRLTVALADRVRSVVGVDISAPMLAKARELDTSGRCVFIENDRPDLAILADRSFDIIVSSLVLQHLPTGLARGYLTELVRVLRPGGVLIVQLTTAPNVSIRGLLVRLLPRRVIRFVQRRVLRYPAPLDMYPMTGAELESAITAAGARLVDAVPEPMYGGNWRYTRYYASRP